MSRPALPGENPEEEAGALLEGAEANEPAEAPCSPPRRHRRLGAGLSLTLLGLLGAAAVALVTHRGRSLGGAVTAGLRWTGLAESEDTPVLVTDGVVFRFSVDFSVSAIRAKPVDVLTSSNGAFEFQVLGSGAGANAGRVRFFVRSLNAVGQTGTVAWLEVVAPMAVKPGTLYTASVSKTGQKLCLELKPASGGGGKACAPSKVDASLFQMKPVGDVAWGGSASLKVSNFVHGGGGVPVYFSARNLDYSLASQGDLKKGLLEAIKRAFSIESSGALQSDDVQLTLMPGLSQNTEVQMTLAVPDGVSATDLQAQLSLSSLSGSLLASVAMVPGVGAGVLIDGLKVGGTPTGCGLVKCPALTEPQPGRTCLGGSCAEVCCASIPCSSFSCEANGFKPLKNSGRCRGEGCADSCCIGNCSGRCHSEQSLCPIKDAPKTCKPSNCQAECCAAVDPPCCKGPQSACLACQQCIPPEVFAHEAYARVEEAIAAHNGTVQPINMSAIGSDAKPDPLRNMLGKDKGLRIKAAMADALASWAPPCTYSLTMEFKCNVTGPANAIAVTTDARHALSGGAGGKIYAWDIKTGQVVQVLDPKPGANSEAVVDIAVSSDAQRAYTADKGGKFYIWAWRTGYLAKTADFKSDISGIADSPEWQVVFVGTKDSDGRGTLVVNYRASTFQKTPYDSITKLPDWKMSRQAWEDDTAGQLASTMKDHQNPELWKQKMINDLLGKMFDRANTVVPDWDFTHVVTAFGPVTAVANVPVRMALVSGYEDGSIRYWSSDTGDLLSCMKGHKGAVTALVAFPSVTQLVSGGQDGTVRIWDLTTGAQLKMYSQVVGGAVTSLAFVPGGLLFAAGSSDGFVHVYHTLREDRCMFDTKGGAVNSISSNPGFVKQLLTASQDGVARVWSDQ